MTMLVFVIGAGLSVVVLNAQDSFFPSKAGIVLTYANNDAKGNTDGYSVLTIKEVKGSGNNMTITYVGTAMDKNRKVVKGIELTYQVVIKNGVAIMDLNQMIPADIKEQGLKMDVSGTPLEVPSPGDLKAGQTLKPSEINVAMDLGIMKTNSVIKTEGKCLAIEDVKVPAGTFKAHKISSKVTTTVMGINNFQTVVEWYAPGIGQVKTETYDDKNKLLSSSVLTELKGK
jgi:hypothetical protein